jgi:hypothetical protein
VRGGLSDTKADCVLARQHTSHAISAGLREADTLRAQVNRDGLACGDVDALKAEELLGIQAAGRGGGGGKEALAQWSTRRLQQRGHARTCS